MVYVDFDQFDDELQIMNDLMKEGQIALRDDSLEIPIELLHLKKAVIVNLGTSLKGCIDKMLARHIGCLLVVDNNKLCGIFTERDVLQRIAGENINLEQAKIDDFMTPNPVSFRLKDTLALALLQMGKGGFRHVAIIDEQLHPISVLSVRDVIGYIVEYFPQDILNLPPHPIRVGTKNQYGG